MSSHLDQGANALQMRTRPVTVNIVLQKKWNSFRPISAMIMHTKSGENCINSLYIRQKYKHILIFSFVPLHDTSLNYPSGIEMRLSMTGSRYLPGTGSGLTPSNVGTTFCISPVVALNTTRSIHVSRNVPFPLGIAKR